MQTLEFVTEAHNGIVTLPQEYQHWNGKKVRVVLLEDNQTPAPGINFKAASIATRNYHFDREAANAR